MPQGFKKIIILKADRAEAKRRQADFHRSLAGEGSGACIVGSQIAALTVVYL